ncbi:MAG: hypothetical protein J7M18_08030, partial [Candidatus Eremiobacteraeota bacterium]|nr:hypothetical protein [Candidatus Eremiobacteraeota bacterium]
VEFLFRQAETYRNKNFKIEAIATLERILEVTEDPGNRYEVYVQMAELKGRKNRPDYESIKEAEKILDSMQISGEERQNKLLRMANMLSNRLCFKEALPLFRQAVGAAPDTEQALYALLMLGKCEKNTGREPDNTMQRIAGHIKTHPEDAEDMASEIADFYLVAGKPEKTREVCVNLLASGEPDSEQNLHTRLVLARAYLQEEMAKEALFELRKFHSLFFSRLKKDSIFRSSSPDALFETFIDSFIMYPTIREKLSHKMVEALKRNMEDAKTAWEKGNIEVTEGKTIIILNISKSAAATPSIINMLDLPPGKAEKQIPALEARLKENSRDINALLLLGRMRMLANKTDYREPLKKVIRLEKSGSEPFLAHIFLAQGRLAEIPDYSSQLATPIPVSSSNNESEAFVNPLVEKHLVAAGEILETIPPDDLNLKNYYLLIAETWKMAGNPEPADKYFEIASRTLDSNFDRLNFKLLSILSRAERGETKIAMKDLPAVRKQVRNMPKDLDNQELWARLGKCEMLLGDYENAVSDLNTAINIELENEIGISAKIDLSVCLADLGKPGKAINILSEATQFVLEQMKADNPGPEIYDTFDSLLQNLYSCPAYREPLADNTDLWKKANTELELAYNAKEEKNYDRAAEHLQHLIKILKKNIK